MPDTDDGKITLAVLKIEIQHLRADIERMSRDLCRKIEDGDRRSGEKFEDHEERLRSLEGSQPWNLYRDVGVLITAVGTAIGSWFSNSN